MNLVSTGARKDLKGFTLIELLVVIAIIGILSAVVLASLSTARSKGQDAKIQEQLSSMRAAAEIYYGTNGNSYGAAASPAGNCSTASSLFVDPASGMQGLVGASNTGGVVNCQSSNTAWAVAANLASNNASSWCADSTGQSKLENALNANSAINATSIACK